MGSKKGTVPDMKNMIEFYVKGNFWQVDQNFLKEVIYPIIQSNSLVHDEYFENKTFPSDRKNKQFVGQAFNEKDEMLYPEHVNHL